MHILSDENNTEIGAKLNPQTVIFRSQLSAILPEDIINLWFKNITFTEKNDKIIIQSCNKYDLDWVKTQYFNEILSIAKHSMNISDIKFEKTSKQSPDIQSKSVTKLENEKKDSDFIEDVSNRIAFSTIKYIIENKNYSVMHGKILHIFGPESCGKTSLLKFLYNTLNQEECVFFSALEFVNTYSTFVRKKCVDEFRSSILSKKFIILDNINLLSSQKGSILEFSKIASVFCDAKKMIITSSNQAMDFMPSDVVEKIKELNCAMSIGIDYPTLDLKYKVLRHHLEKNDINSTKIHDGFVKKASLRDIINNIAKIAVLKTSKNLDLFADFKISNVIDDSKIKGIINTVTTYFNIDLEKILGRGGGRSKSLAKYIIMYLLRKHTNMTMQQIAQTLHLKSHANVSKSILLLQNNKNLDISNIILKIEKELNL